MSDQLQQDEAARRRGVEGEQRDAAMLLCEDVARLAAAGTITRVAKSHLARRHAPPPPPAPAKPTTQDRRLEGTVSAAAVAVQRTWRGHSVRLRCAAAARHRRWAQQLAALRDELTVAALAPLITLTTTTVPRRHINDDDGPWRADDVDPSADADFFTALPALLRPDDAWADVNGVVRHLAGDCRVPSAVLALMAAHRIDGAALVDIGAQDLKDTFGVQDAAVAAGVLDCIAELRAECVAHLGLPCDDDDADSGRDDDDDYTDEDESEADDGVADDAESTPDRDPVDEARDARLAAAADALPTMTMADFNFVEHAVHGHVRNASLEAMNRAAAFAARGPQRAPPMKTFQSRPMLGRQLLADDVAAATDRHV
jgi:hypothetical protein